MGPIGVKEKSRCIESFCHVTQLHCGTAALFLGCAERSKPRSRVRRAEGAGLDGECADRAIIIVAATYKGHPQLFDPRWIFIVSRLLSRSLKFVLDVIRGGARQRARKSRHSLVFGRSARIGAMMQSCASAAKLRGGGSILHSGVGSHGFYVGSPPPRIYRQTPSLGCQVGCPVVLFPSMLALMMPDVRRCHPTVGR